MKPFTKKLVLENGREFYGYGYGADVERVCEIVFNTSVVGYQEIISDPSNLDQIVVMAYPLIGNYGITDEDFESKLPMIGGMVVRECNENPSNFRYTKTFSETLDEQGIPCIAGVDTRMIVRIIRDEGTQRAAIVNADTTLEKALEMIKSTPLPKNQVSKVSCRKRWFSRTPNHTYDIVAVDCGIKHNIINHFTSRGCNVTVVPYTTTLEEIKAFNPDGIFISNGPGDPCDVPEVVELIKSIGGSIPVFGISLGMELIALAYGAKVEKMKCGHHGSSAVRSLATGRIDMTAQNHSYVVAADSLAGTGLEVTHENVLDGTVEGIECVKDKMYAVQFHPESAPGPQDSAYLFDKFIKLMEEYQNA
ncbi:MAG: glutamine-hydrolyzing carbamoyl-phosphate synthase small subunit [Rikenellaceae bacterium]|nr:glutamine-hydrolyzing carbamoyl-phosphate synthase small subunit [Rikenellaceae bacterium]